MMLTTALTCLALNIYHEARGETQLGKEVVAVTTLNRANGNNSQVCAEVLKKHQFTWTTTKVSGKQLREAGKPKETEAWEEAQQIAKKALSGRIVVPAKYRNVTHFCASRKRAWDKNPQMNYVGKVGNHHFYEQK